MRRTEIIEGAQQILSALSESSLLTILQDVSKGKPNPESATALLSSLRLYTIRAQSFNSAAKEIATILEIDRLEAPSVWAKLIKAEDSHLYSSLFWDLRFATDYLPKLLRLIERSDFQQPEKGGVSKTGLSVLTVLVFEPENTLSSPIRLANVLESINHFYTACALLGKESPSTLSVISCDSGSDKTFDFLGLASVMECVERIITTIWDRVFFYREYQFEERLDLISKSLPILTEITRMEDHKEIEPELAEILKRNIFDGTNKFVQSGATIPQIEDRSEYDSRKLLSPVQRLLVSPSAESLEEEAKKASPGESVDSSSFSNMDFNKLSVEEQQAFRELFEKVTKRDEPASLTNKDEIESIDEHDREASD